MFIRSGARRHDKMGLPKPKIVFQEKIYNKLSVESLEGFLELIFVEYFKVFCFLHFYGFLKFLIRLNWSSRAFVGHLIIPSPSSL